MPGRLPDPPPTPWARQCTLMGTDGKRCMQPRVMLATPPTMVESPWPVSRQVESSAPRIVLACLRCDFGDRPDAGPPRVMEHVRRGGA